MQEQLIEYKVLTVILAAMEDSKNNIYEIELPDLSIKCNLPKEDTASVIHNLMKARFPMNRFSEAKGSKIKYLFRQPTISELTWVLRNLWDRDKLTEWKSVTPV